MFKSFIALVILSVLIDEQQCLTQSQPSEDGLPLVDLGGQSYYFGTNFTLNFFEAMEFCRYQGMDLLSVESLEEMTNIVNYLKSSDDNLGPCTEIGKLIPDPKNCSNFNVCTEKGWIGQFCYPGLEFNAETSQCDYPENVNCSVVISTKTEETFPTFWTSGSDLGEEGSFVWLATGKSFDFTYWGPSSPNNADNNENCMVISKAEDKNYRWDDVTCTDTNNFICELRKCSLFCM